MVHIAILGYGVIGSGIAQVLAQNRVYIERKAGQVINVKRVLDKLDFPGDPVEPILTHDINDILNDEKIKIVAEVMGGVTPAYSFVKQALLANKSVCTSNKELVIAHGAELLRIAKERELNFMFEASVGGGIPIVRPINLALTTDEIVGIAGILNGTSNYILTSMNAYAKGFDEALAEAQALGYAESSPAQDVKGYDACRKLAILLSLATGKQVDYDDIHTEGITDIGTVDFDFARSFGYTIKLLVDGRIKPNGVEALVAPCLVHHSHPLYTVNDVFNGVLVQAKVTDNVMFYGRGAGKLPTAGAVVSDIVDVSKHLHRHIMHDWLEEKMPVLDSSSYIKRKMIRISCSDPAQAKEAVACCMGFGSDQLFSLPDYPNFVAWLTQQETERETAQKLALLAQSPGVTKIENVFRIYEPIVLNV